MKWDLDFISKEDFYKHTRETIENYFKTTEPINLKKFNKNIIDPIKITFDSFVYDKDIKQLILLEIDRQRDKTNNNIIGYFHQNIFKYIKNCEVPKTGWDIIFNDGKNKYYVEMKNKHNTMNSSSKAETYKKMYEQISKDKNCICVLVEVISQKSQNTIWKPSQNNELYLGTEKILKMSIDRFFELVTGDPNAFFKICKNLPLAIQEIKTEMQEKKDFQDSVIRELEETNEDLLSSLFQLAFNEYNGFQTKKTPNRKK